MSLVRASHQIISINGDSRSLNRGFQYAIKATSGQKYMGACAPLYF